MQQKGVSPAQRGQVAAYRPIEALLPAHWTEGTVEANGAHHHYYRTGGDKPPLVLLHGFQESGLTWLRVAHDLERDYDLLMPDARGHGRSDRAGADLSEGARRDDALGLSRALGLARPILLGHSLGAITAALVAVAEPALARAVVLEDPPWDARPPASIAGNPGYLAWFESWLAWLERLQGQDHPTRLVTALDQLMGRPTGPEEDYVAWADASAHLDLDMMRRSLALWSAPATLAHDLAPRFTVPTLVLRAAQPSPRYGPPATVSEEASPWPLVTIRRFADTGHLIHQEQPATFVAAVRAFLAGL